MAGKKKTAPAPAPAPEPEPLEEELEAEAEEEEEEEEETASEEEVLPETAEVTADEIDEDPPDDGPTYQKQLTKAVTRVMGLLDKQFGQDEPSMQRVVRSVGALVGLKLVVGDLDEVLRKKE